MGALDRDIELNVGGLIAILIFYLLIFAAGILAQKVFVKLKLKRDDLDKEGKPMTNTNNMILAGRNINYVIGVFTMTATWVGGGYINGAAEAVIKNGLVWCQAPFCYAISLVCGGFFFAKQMRNKEYITMLDPLQVKYGANLGAFFYIPAFCGEILWSASILAALGTSLRVICGISDEASIIISAGIAMTYTLFGGLYSVAFTDIIQLCCIFLGLIISIPFMTANKLVNSPLEGKPIYQGKETPILGSIKGEDAALWCDYAIMMICGGIPWQAYFQRVLSSKDANVARVLSWCAGFGCFCAAIPAVIIGIITLNTDWSQTPFLYLTKAEAKLSVPLCLQYLCPTVVSFIGLGAVSAAVMSSTDSSILGISSMFTNNVFKKVFWPKCPDKISVIVLRLIIVVNTIIAMVIAIAVKSVYGLYLICSDLVFVLLFPHLVLVVHFQRWTNKYGMAVGFSTCLLLRVLAGENVLGYDAIIKFPYYSEGLDGAAGYQRFPFRVLLMVLHFIIVLLVSAIAEKLNDMGILAGKFDILREWEREDVEDVVVENKGACNDQVTKLDSPAAVEED